ncbi:MAG: 2'-5' RNA ligase family protein [Gemmatimonadaceae bacterium]|nr:2'-5' RNA ligase family protein [Gemmatimonadaceae bacterium]
MSTAPASRQQLTLFVPAPWQTSIDALRRRLDPVQASLIAAHVTLCREDEISPTDRDEFLERVRSWTHGPIRLTFGAPELFRGHGVLLPCTEGGDQFQRLRQWLLQSQTVRVHRAHLTLAHPRNPQSAENTAAVRNACGRSTALEFPTVALIVQQGNARWRIAQEERLGGGTRGPP